MTFTRLSRGDLVAAVAALLLIVVMSLTWYGTKAGDAARHAADHPAQTTDAASGELERERASAEQTANRAEQNAWEADGGADRVVLVVLLAAAALATAAAWLRAADVRFGLPWTPSVLATATGFTGALLVAFRIAQKPSADAGAVVKLGAPLGLVCVGLLTLGARAAWRWESDRRDVESGGEGTGRRAAEPAPALAATGAAATTGDRHLWSEQPDTAESPALDWAPDWSDDSPDPGAPEASPAAPEPEPRGRAARRRAKRERRGRRT
ncbi:MAG: hypothetical protein QOJ07_3575 [Thermoleophilaceae bacterium]|nr:hypothetical protein [Thermoleophilaceae bacterium]